MAKPPPRKPGRPLTTEEKLGHAWGAMFVGMVLLLVVTLVGKACFFTG